MGINVEEAKAILSLRRSGAVGTDILCLGRPELFVGRRALSTLSDRFGRGWNEAEIAAIAADRFAEPFLAHAGFTAIGSLDATAYENASVIHDLNTPIPAALEASTDFVYDCGTAEHIFDIAQVFRNIVRLLRVGGTVLMSTPANGQCGHGFYQLSPELFYRLFEANGFETVRVYGVGLMPPARWVRIADPKVLGRRVQFMTAEPLQLIVVARKARDVGAFVTPQQSDYEAGAWTSSEAGLAERTRAWSRTGTKVRSALRDRVVYPLAVPLRHMFGIGMPGLWRRAHFAPFDPWRDPLV